MFVLIAEYMIQSCLKEYLQEANQQNMRWILLLVALWAKKLGMEIED